MSYGYATEAGAGSHLSAVPPSLKVLDGLVNDADLVSGLLGDSMGALHELLNRLGLSLPPRESATKDMPVEEGALGALRGRIEEGRRKALVVREITQMLAQRL